MLALHGSMRGAHRARSMDHRQLAALDLNLLVVLDALLAEGSVSRAGRRVGLSQPAMSRALGRLRAALRDELFVRSGRQMLPTPRATRLAPLLRRQLRELAALLTPEARFDAARSARVFAVAATDYVERVLLIPLLAALRAEAPGVRLVIRPAVEGEVARAETGDVDLGIAPWRGDAPGLARRTLFTDRYTLVLRAGHPALRQEPTLEQLAALPAIQVSPDGHGRSAVDDLLADRGLSRRVVYRTPTFASALAAVRASDLAVTLPARALGLAEAPGLVARVVEALPPLAVHLLRHERFLGDPGNQWLADRVTAAARALPDSPRSGARVARGARPRARRGPPRRAVTDGPVALTCQRARRAAGPPRWHALPCGTRRSR
jgi:DNA-binding transcriptional LysR family regulator